MRTLLFWSAVLAAAQRRAVPLLPVSACSRPPPAYADRPSIIHLITFSTHNAAQVLDCWLQWAAHVIARDTTPQRHYRLHLRSFGVSNISAARLSARAKRATASAPAGTFLTAAWYAALNAKLVVVSELMEELRERSGEEDVFIITDLDVLPLRPYSALLPCLEHEITFMRWRCRP